LAVLHPEGEVQSKFFSRPKYNIREGLGFVAFGRDPVSLDAILCNIAGFDFKQFWGYIDMAKDEGFGAYDREALRESKMKVESWLSP